MVVIDSKVFTQKQVYFEANQLLDEYLHLVGYCKELDYTDIIEYGDDSITGSMSYIDLSDPSLGNYD